MAVTEITFDILSGETYEVGPTPEPEIASAEAIRIPENVQPDETSPVAEETKQPPADPNAAWDETIRDVQPVQGQSPETPQRRAEREFQERMTELSMQLVAASVARHRIEAELKLAKGEEKRILELLEKHTARGPLVVEAASSEQPEGQAAEQPVAAVVTKTAGDEWKKVSLGELKAFGLSQSVHDKLVESGLETIGQLEERRSEISMGKAKWPKGIGEAKITMIENAVSEWWAKNRDSGLFATEPTKEVEQPVSAEQPPAVEQPAAETQEASPEIPATVPVESQSAAAAEPVAEQPAAVEAKPPQKEQKKPKAKIPQFMDLL